MDSVSIAALGVGAATGREAKLKIGLYVFIRFISLE